MKLFNSKLSDHIIEYHAIGLGQFFFLKNIVVAEINEGVHMDFQASKEFITLISDFYGTKKPFGYVCNRINNFSISPLDFPKFNKALPNLTIFGIVHNNHFDRMNYEIEKRFCNRPYKSYSDLYSALSQVESFIKNISKRVDITQGKSIVENNSLN